ncbi:MAG TPA: PQQ-dependent sugar dehydrogenase [Thermoanaerobaculia bacterium]|nr:PQQ-dependent sugar dehydrogenase [Thermoanaerobaculia bacterium]
MLPGFRVEKLADTAGFVSSLAFAPAGTLYYSTTAGGVFRLDGTTSTLAAEIPSADDGNAALLGIAFRSNHEFISHSVPPGLTANVISAYNLATGDETELARFLCDAGRPCSSEHRGGNTVIGPDGSIFVGIGDYGGPTLAQNPDSPGGKIWRIAPDGGISMFALGFRNPFDLAVHPTSGELIVADNGPVAGDEIHIIREGDNAGWPFTVGNDPPLEGAVSPDYTWDETIAPTGVFYVRGPLPMQDGGLLVASFVTSAIYYFPDLSIRPLDDPLVLIERETGSIIDLVQNGNGDIFFATAFGIYRLHLPIPGDANGNGRIDSDDGRALANEIVDGDGMRTVDASRGGFAGSWGADANQDGVIDSRDLVTLGKMRNGRTRPARR